MLIGLPAFWELCQLRAGVPVLAHPAFGGALRIAPEALFGQLFRLFGADAVIFVSFGSRFAASREPCRRLAANLRESWPGVMPSLPVPAGGIEAENAAEVVAFYGRDSMLLVGGSLQAGPGQRRAAQPRAGPHRRARGAGSPPPQRGVRAGATSIATASLALTPSGVVTSSRTSCRPAGSRTSARLPEAEPPGHDHA